MKPENGRALADTNHPRSRQEYFRNSPMDWFRDGSNRYSRFHWEQMDLQAKEASREVLAAIEGSEDPLVAVIGFGFGRETEILIESGVSTRVIGIDINGSRFDEAKKVRPRIFEKQLYPVTASMDGLPFGGNSFDALLCLETMMHSDNPRQTLEEFIRVTKPGGVIVMNLGTSFGPVNDLVKMLQNEGINRVLRRIKERALGDRDSSSLRTLLSTREEIRDLLRVPGVNVESSQSYLRGFSTLVVLRKLKSETNPLGV